MNRFVRRLAIFLAPLLVIFVVGLLLPPTPKMSHSLVFASERKDSLLLYAPPPRLIMIGGSSLSFGINSQILHDSLHLHPVNMGLSASIGIEFMLRNVRDHLLPGDVVLLALEYDHFYQPLGLVSPQLFRAVWEVDRSKVKFLSWIQILRLMQHLPDNALSKLSPLSYDHGQMRRYYNVDSFNEYGDAVEHWGADRKYVEPLGRGQGVWNKSVMELIKEFVVVASGKGVIVIVTFPGIQERSFQALRDDAETVKRAYVANGMIVAGEPEDFVYPDGMIFDTPYHLTKEGADMRSRKLSSQLKWIIAGSSGKVRVPSSPAGSVHNWQ